MFRQVYFKGVYMATETTLIRVKEETKKLIKVQAALRGMTFDEFLNEAIKVYISD